MKQHLTAFRQQILLLAFLPGIIVSLLMGCVYRIKRYNELDNQLMAKALTQSEQQAAVASLLLNKTRHEDLQTLISLLLNDRDIRAQWLLNDILDFSRMEAGKLELDPQPVCLREIVEDVLTFMTPAAYGKSLEIVHFIYDDVPEHIIIDELRLKQILTNLISNAIKFTSYGSVAVKDGLDDDLVTLRDGWAANNYSAVLERVHRLHGDCRYCGVPELERICNRLETRLKKYNTLNHDKITEDFQLLLQSITRLNKWEIKSLDKTESEA